MASVSVHLHKLHAVLRLYGLPESTLSVVEDVKKWCEANAVEESNPLRAAKVFYTGSRCAIVIREVQTVEMIESAKLHMEINGFKTEVATLNSEEKYLMHLMLHEIAAFVLQNSEQHARDRWAFTELEKLA